MKNLHRDIAIDSALARAIDPAHRAHAGDGLNRNVARDDGAEVAIRALLITLARLRIVELRAILRTECRIQFEPPATAGAHLGGAHDGGHGNTRITLISGLVSRTKRDPDDQSSSSSISEERSPRRAIVRCRKRRLTPASSAARVTFPFVFRIIARM